MGRIAAIDFGLKRIGIALSDEKKIIALPFTTVEGGKKGVANILKAVEGKGVESFLVGLPLLLNGKKGEMAETVERFAVELEQSAKVRVILRDERLSSKHADAGLRELSLKRKERSEKLDMVAATFLLQSYLDELT